MPAGTWDDLAGTFETVAAIIKWRRDASHALVRVRRIDESDEQTLKRVVGDYAQIFKIVNDYASTDERRLLEHRWEDTLPSILAKILERAKRASEDHAKITSILRAHAGGSDQGLLDERWADALPAILSTILERAKPESSP